MKIGDIIKSGDFKGEKHVPVIEAPASAKAGEDIKIELSVGKEIAHPNTIEHHIDWIKLYFKPASSNFAVELGGLNFVAHGACPVAPAGCLHVSLNEGGTLIAVSYCNLHGLWESSAEITIEA